MENPNTPAFTAAHAAGFLALGASMLFAAALLLPTELAAEFASGAVRRLWLGFMGGVLALTGALALLRPVAAALVRAVLRGATLALERENAGAAPARVHPPPAAAWRRTG